MDGKAQGKDKITALILFGFSLFYLFSSFRLKLGNIKYPGPGFIPMIIGSLLLLCTTWYLIQVLRTKIPEGGPKELGQGKNYRVIYGILACTMVYPFILEFLKFLTSTTIVAFFMLFLLKPQRPFFAFFLAWGMAVTAFLVFSRLLGVALPFGFLEELLFRWGG